MPIRLKFAPRSSTVALESVLLRGNKITSLAVQPYVNPVPLLHQLFMHSRPTVEQLHIYTNTHRTDESAAREIWQDLPSLRELFVYRYSIPIDHLVAPNLVHLALEQGGHDPTVKSTLDMLRGCPLLETLLIVHSSDYADQTRDHSPVSLLHLRGIELGASEVHSGLMTHLQFPPNVAVGFRELITHSICGEIAPSVMATTQHVLRSVNICRITLAAPPSPHQHLYLVRFEGPGGSLEITIFSADHGQLEDIFFGQGGVLFSHSPRIENVRELHVVGCPFDDNQRLDHINAAMPNLVSISFFNCFGRYMFGSLLTPTPTNPSSPPFPQLESIMVLGQKSGLTEMVKARRDFGVPLKAVVIGRGFKVFEYDHREDYSALEGLVDDLRIGCPTEIVEWGTENEILNIWSASEALGPVSPNVNPMALG